MTAKKKKIEKKKAMPKKIVSKKAISKKVMPKNAVPKKDLSKQSLPKKEVLTKSIPQSKKPKSSSSVKTKVKPKPDNKAVTRIIVGFDDEITSLIEQIEGTPSKRVVITIPLGSDLLISSVLMKLVSQKADELNKNIVIVTDDKTGEKMARLAGFIVKGSTSEVDDNLWEKVESAKTVIKEGKSGPELKAALDEGLGLPPKSSDFVNKDFQDDIGRMKGEDATVSEPEGDRLDVGKMEVEGGVSKDEPDDPMDLGRDRDDVLSDRGAGAVRKVKKGGFEMTVDSTSSGKSAGNADSSSGVSDPTKRGLVGRDFSGYESVGQKSDSRFDSKYDELPSRDAADVAVKSPRRKAGITKSGIMGKVSKIFSPATLAKISAVFTTKKIVTILIPLIVIFVIGFAFVGWYLPEVVVSIEIESISVEYEGEITVLTSADGTNVEELVIPAKDETILKNGSDNGVATGVASRGEKATGTVIIFNKTTEAVSLPAGTILSNGGLNFILQGTVNLDAADPPVTPMTQADGNVVAEAVGSEYNIEGGTEFGVGSYAMGEVSAANSDAFIGGSKEDYKVVGQDDIDKVADELEKSLYTEAEEELSREGQDSRWVFVKSSVKNEIDGDVESDVPAGAEQDSFNVSLKTRSTALYYDGDALNGLIEELLLSEVDEDEDMSGLELSEDLEQVIEVKSASVDGGKIVLTVQVSGFVMPKLDEQKIENGLQARGWADGLKYLKQLDYVSGDPDVDFYPTWFPDFMKRMPSREGRITVNVKNIDPSEDSDDEGDADGSESESSEEE